MSLEHILRTGLDWRRFPTFCAVLVGGSSLLEVSPFRYLSLPALISFDLILILLRYFVFDGRRYIACLKAVVP
jgi:hypothetical protein